MELWQFGENKVPQLLTTKSRFEYLIGAAQHRLSTSRRTVSSDSEIRGWVGVFSMADVNSSLF